MSWTKGILVASTKVLLAWRTTTGLSLGLIASTAVMTMDFIVVEAAALTLEIGDEVVSIAPASIVLLDSIGFPVELATLARIDASVVVRTLLTLMVVVLVIISSIKGFAVVAVMLAWNRIVVSTDSPAIVDLLVLIPVGFSVKLTILAASVVTGNREIMLIVLFVLVSISTIGDFVVALVVEIGDVVFSISRIIILFSVGFPVELKTAAVVGSVVMGIEDEVTLLLLMLIVLLVIVSSVMGFTVVIEAVVLLWNESIVSITPIVDLLVSIPVDFPVEFTIVAATVADASVVTGIEEVTLLV